MPDMMREELMSLADASKILPGRPNISTLHRWRLRGVHGIRLETLLVGGRRCTSREAIDRFCQAVTAAAAGEKMCARTPRQREHEIEMAERKLKGRNNRKPAAKRHIEKAAPEIPQPSAPVTGVHDVRGVPGTAEENRKGDK